jgi:23S rRNA pseudouridine1911/1915/1917 synthase
VLSRTLTIADVVDIVPTGHELAAPPPPQPSLILLHEDGWVVAVDKPAGVASQPPRARRPGELTLQERLALQLARRGGRRVELVLFHRLDRLTTGIMLFARHHDAARALAQAWGEDRAEKHYLAVVRGDPGEKPLALSAPIGGDPLSPARQRVARAGRPARTEVKRLARAGDFALVELRPHTGRTHQVRVHLAHAGFPVAGDTLYGGRGGVPRPFLHAWRLVLPHPRTGRPLRLQAPVPADMAAFLAHHGVDVAVLLAAVPTH